MVGEEVMMWPLIIVAGAAAAAYELFLKSPSPPVSNTGVSVPPPQGTPATVQKGITSVAQGVTNIVMPTLSPDNLVPVVFNGEVWLVAPDYVGPIGINEAVTLAQSNGFTLPSPGLVDAIWRQADLKVVPLPRQNIISQAVFDDQKARIAAQVGGRDFTLLGGSFKDVVLVNGRPSIYGWHVDVEHGATVPGVPLLSPITAGPGKIIQPFAGGAHDQPGPIGFKDYSQGARLVKRA
jgi:hypothetical protein